MTGAVVVGGDEWNTECSCGAPATRKLAAIAYCDVCIEAILEPIRERVILREGLEGVGLRDGINRPEHGPGMADLRCNACGATWVGIVGEPCSWCAEALERMQRWQAQLLLRPELPDPDDVRYDAAVGAWAGRLARGVQAELITEHEARAAIVRQEARRVA